MNVTSIEEPSPKPTYFSNDNPEQCNTEAILPVDEEVEAMDIGMDVSTPPLDQVKVEVKEKQAIKSFDLLVTSTEEPAPKYLKPRDDKSSSSETDNSSDYEPSSFLDEPSDASNNDKNSPPSVPITEAQAEESANLTSQVTSAPALGEVVISDLQDSDR
uniref:Ovule protein n=1 Tax=Haemonchus contortus TaxID=6289 RepID=A0A7I4XSM7_HAECO